MSVAFPSMADIAKSPTSVRAYLMQPRKEGAIVVCDFCDWQARTKEAEAELEQARDYILELTCDIENLRRDYDEAEGRLAELEEDDTNS